MLSLLMRYRPNYAVLKMVGVLLFTFSTPMSAQLLPVHLDGLSPREIGPANMSGRLVDIAVVEMDTRVYYLASATGGVWKLSLIHI